MDLPFTDAAGAALISLLRQRGAMTAAELSAALGKSQPTLSRLLRALASEVLVLRQGRSTRYALPQTLLGQPARQPLYWTHADGRIEHWGEASLLAGGRLHVAAAGIDLVAEGLPWFLAPLRAQGFLGRVLARQLAPNGLDANPERWTLAHLLFAALQLHDTPGSLWLGNAGARAEAPVVDDDASFDALAGSVASTLPAGSSAGGEQAKFLARTATGEAVLVKFTPPRGTPFGERWHDLLWAEHLALQLLAEHGVPVATSRIVSAPQRTHLVSPRFDRAGPGAGAAAIRSTDRQQRHALRQPGRLHRPCRRGRRPWHAGPPLYDMLPMRWRPDANSGGLGLTPFTPDEIDLQSAARPLAVEYWGRVAGETVIGGSFKNVATQMLSRLR